MAAADPDPELVSGGPSGSLLRDRKLLAILIAGGVMAFVVTTVVGFSGAVFTSTSSSPGNEYAAAGMGLTLARTGQLVDGSGMVAGDSRSGTQTITNNGHRGRLTLDARGVDGQSPLAKVLTVVVEQTDPAQAQPAYSGPLTGLSSVLLGMLAQGESRSYRVTLTWPAGTGAGAAGTSTTLTFDWQIESVP